MIPDEKRGRGLWYKRMREDHGYDSARKLLDAMSSRGIFIHASQYADLEGHGKMDTRRSREIAEQVAAFYGEGIPNVAVTDSSGQGMAELIEALNRQTAQMSELVSRLDTLSQRAIRDGVADALRELALLQNAAASRSEQPPGQQP